MTAHNENWYLATYAPPENNRQRLFQFLAQQNITAWTPEYESVTADRRKTVRALFTGYFFLRLSPEQTPLTLLYEHSGFSGFVRCGEQLQPVPDTLVARLLRTFPHVLPAGDSRYPPRQGLTRAEYRYLVRVLTEKNTTRRNDMLLQLISCNGS